MTSKAKDIDPLLKKWEMAKKQFQSNSHEELLDEVAALFVELDAWKQIDKLRGRSIEYLQQTVSALERQIEALQSSAEGAINQIGAPRTNHLIPPIEHLVKSAGDFRRKIQAQIAKERGINGGNAAARERANQNTTRDGSIVKAAQELERNGTANHEIASKLATRFKLSASQIRRILNRGNTTNRSMQKNTRM